MKVTREIELDRGEEYDMDNTALCPMCKKTTLSKGERCDSWVEYKFVKGEWVEVKHEILEASSREFKCTNPECDFEYDHPC